MSPFLSDTLALLVLLLGLGVLTVVARFLLFPGLLGILRATREAFCRWREARARRAARALCLPCAEPMRPILRPRDVTPLIHRCPECGSLSLDPPGSCFEPMTE